MNAIGAETDATPEQSTMSLSDVFASGHGTDDPEAFQEWLDRLNDGPSVQMAGSGDDLMDQLDLTEAERRERQQSSEGGESQQGGPDSGAGVGTPHLGGRQSDLPQTEVQRHATLLATQEQLRRKSLEVDELRRRELDMARVRQEMSESQERMERAVSSIESKLSMSSDIESRSATSAEGMTPAAARQNELALQTPPTNVGGMLTAREQYDAMVQTAKKVFGAGGADESTSQAVSTKRGGSTTSTTAKKSDSDDDDDTEKVGRKSSAEYAGMAIVESEREKRIKAAKEELYSELQKDDVMQ